MIPGYEKLGQIGIGARSTIHKVVETSTGEIYALKHVVRDDEEDDRFLQQAENGHSVASQVEHLHLRRSHAIHRVRRWTRLRELYVVMEYVEGMTLEVARPNRLEGFLQIVRKVALGLDGLHQAGFVHADIKPNNVMLGKDGLVKIIDFGQSCPIGHRKERIQGTPDYIAPEQVRRMPLDQRTDVFNLGATMYWVLTDRPFPTDIRQPLRRSEYDIAGPKQILTPKEVNPRIPAVLSQLIMDCCRPNPEDRPIDMTQFLSRLEVVQRMWRKHWLSIKTKRKVAKEAKSSAVQRCRSTGEQSV